MEGRIQSFDSINSFCLLHIINIFILSLSERAAVNGSILLCIDHASSSISPTIPTFFYTHNVQIHMCAVVYIYFRQIFIYFLVVPGEQSNRN